MLVFNRIVSLKSSWRSSAAARPTEAAPVVADAGATEGRRKRVRRGKGEVVLTPEQQARLTAYGEQGVSDKASRLLVDNPAAGALHDDAVAAGGDPATVGKLIANDLAGKVDDLGALSFDGAALARLVGLLTSGQVSNAIARTVLGVMIADGGDPAKIIAERGLSAVSDADTLGPIVDAVIAANPDKVAAYQGGNARMLGFFVGQVMRQTGGKADPGVVNALLGEKLAG